MVQLVGRSPWEGNGNPVQYSCLENPTDRGAWWAKVHGLAKNQTWFGSWAQAHRRSSIHQQWSEQSIRKNTNVTIKIISFGYQKETLVKKEPLHQNTWVGSDRILGSGYLLTLHMNLTRWSTNEIGLIIFFAAKDGEALYSQQKARPGTYCNSYHQLLIAKFWLKLKKVGKTTRPFMDELNQIPYDYTVEVTNRFKGLDLVECLNNYEWRSITLYRRQWLKPSPRKRNAQKQNVCVRRPYK